jgi:hypothetical protein
VGGYFYDPWYGAYPWWGPGYGYGYYPVFDSRAEVRIQATPRDAAVYVDGYYAGIVDDFDGVFQRLPVTPGGHRIEIYLEGFRTVRRNLYLQPATSMKLHETLVPLAAGQVSERPEVAPDLPPPPDGSFTDPRGRGPRELPPPGDPRPRRVPRDPRDAQETRRRPADGFGTLVLRVQPGDAEVSIDGQRWVTSGSGEFELQIPAGRHRVEVEREGYQQFSADVDVRDGEPTPFNVSLSRGR